MNNCENCVHHIDDVCEHYYELNVTTCTGFRPVTPKGEWIYERPNGKTYSDFVYCSECQKPNGFYKTNFCPNCGADMRGKDNDVQ